MKFLLILFIPVFIFSFLRKKYDHQKNHPPAVRFTTPENNSSFPWNTAVRYKINVSDQEDGESKYREISPKEVILEVRYVEKDTIKKSFKISPGLAVIESSNCFNCHHFNTKSTGPSFKEINKHYEHSQANIELLAHRIKAGSSGIWGNETMPAHSSLTDQQTKNIVQWIFRSANDSSLNFYTGIQGSFIIKKRGSFQTGSFILTAIYTDHGTKDDPQERLTGRDVIVIHGKE